ncbi:unnamed protein product [Cuscuta campestris]|uniref:Uncharacterized protein n=1 Tax=Cuscuta campestris TaxID=132261 RepID=A0A484MAG9_9ASTE|nr:unnamed protein product [Cuscuta campestris]
MYQDSDGEDYYEPHGDHDDYDHNGPIYDDQPDPVVEEIIRLEQKIFYFDELLFAEGSWYEPPYSRDYTLFAEEQIEANNVAIRERAKLLESVRKEKEFERILCEGSNMMQKMLDHFQGERLEAEAKADILVNDLCKAIELKRSLQPQDPQLEEVNAQKETLEPKTNPEPSNHQVPILEDSPSSTPSQKPESITTLAGATVVMTPEYPPSQVSTGTVVHEVEPTEGPDSEPPTLIQEKDEEVLPREINDHLLNCVEDTPPEEPVLEEIEPTTNPQDSNESKQESTDGEILCLERPTPSIETRAHNASSEGSDQTFFDSLLDGCDYVCPKDDWNLKSWDELLMDVAWMIPHGNRRTLQNLEELPLHSEEARKKFLTWGNTKMLQSPMVLDPAYLDELGHWQDIDEFLYNPKWRILLFLQAPASLEVTIEFLCSLRFHNDGEEVKSTAEVTSTTKVTFTLMGRLLSLTVADLGWLIGLYTLDETRSLAFPNLPDQLDLEFDVKKFWQAHGYGRYHSGASMARNWVRPSWRILHHALTHSYLGRSHDPDVVFDSDMLFFWSLEARVPVNLATFVARFLFAQSTSNHQFVLCGPMVTLLARGLCMTVPDVLPEAASMFRPSTRYLTQIAYNKEDKEARPRKQHRIPMTLRELSQAMFAFQDSMDSRLRSMETLLLTQQWQVEEILDPGARNKESRAQGRWAPFYSKSCGEEVSRGGQRKRSRIGKNVGSSSAPPPPVHKYLDGSFLWFNDREEAARFSEKFEHREILPPRFSTGRFIHGSIPREARVILERGRFLELLYIKKNDYHPFLVRAFYSNLKKDEDGSLISNVNGVEIYLNEENIQILTGLRRDGQDLGLYVGEEGARFNEATLLELVGIRNFVPTPQQRRPTITSMSPVYRFIFYVLTQILKPRKFNHTTLSQEDTKTLHAMINNANINWCKFVMTHMFNATSDNRPLPYALLVMAILDEFHIKTDVGPKCKGTKHWEIDESSFYPGTDEATFPQPRPRRQPRAAASTPTTSTNPSLAEQMAALTTTLSRIDTNVSKKAHNVDILSRELHGYFDFVNYPYAQMVPYVPPPNFGGEPSGTQNVGRDDAVDVEEEEAEEEEEEEEADDDDDDDDDDDGDGDEDEENEEEDIDEEQLLNDLSPDF